MIKSDSIIKISVSLVKAQTSMGNATKTSSNPFFKNKYADLNAIREACLPALHENNICVLQPVINKDGKNYVQTLLLHESGEFIGCETEIKTVKQNDPQAEGSGISYARRYGLQSLVCLGAEDDDGNKATEQPKKQQPKTGPVAVAKKDDTVVSYPDGKFFDADLKSKILKMIEDKKNTYKNIKEWADGMANLNNFYIGKGFVSLLDLAWFEEAFNKIKPESEV